MRAVAIEYDVPGTNAHKKGYLRIPEDFPGDWSIGFRKYIRDKYNMKPSDDIDIYPYMKRTTSEDMGWTPFGYINMEDDFILALRSTEYYPDNEKNNALRRSWVKMEPSNQMFIPKDR